MKKENFEALLQGVRDATAYARGDGSRAITHVVQDIDVAQAREALGLTQEQFAAAFGVSMATLRNWEQGHRSPTGPARVLLQVIKNEPEAVLRVVRKGTANTVARKIAAVGRKTARSHARRAADPGRG